jgi:hypothetical protein
MAEHEGACRYELAYEVQFKHLNGELAELKTRVQRLEATLARGVLLLVANLACVIVTLAQLVLR